MRCKRLILISSLAVVLVVTMGLGASSALEFSDWERTWHKAKFKVKATCYATALSDYFKVSDKDNAWIYIESYNEPYEFSASLVTLDEDGTTWQSNAMTLEILHGTANEAMVELVDPITITDGGTGDNVRLLSFFTMLKGKEKNSVLHGGAMKTICGTAMIEAIGQAECFGPLSFSSKKINGEKVPQKVFDAVDGASRTDGSSSKKLKIFVSSSLHHGDFANDPTLSGATAMEKADAFCMRDSNRPTGGSISKALLGDGVNRDAVTLTDWVFAAEYHILQTQWCQNRYYGR